MKIKVIDNESNQVEFEGVAIYLDYMTASSKNIVEVMQTSEQVKFYVN
jgi:hypothetical protein